MNRSSQKTKALIRKTFTELASEKGELSKISVTELVNRADINRSTFYTHYSDIYEIAEEFQNEIMNEVMSRSPKDKDEAYKFLDEIYECFHKNEGAYRMFLSSDDARLFLTRLRNKIVEKILNVPDIKNNGDRFTCLRVEMYVDGMAEQMIRYFRGKNSYGFGELKKGLLEYARESF